MKYVLFKLVINLLLKTGHIYYKRTNMLMSRKLISIRYCGYVCLPHDAFACLNHFQRFKIK